MLYYLNTIKKNNNTALGKAPKDISEILSKMDAKEITFHEARVFSFSLLTKIFALVTGVGNWLKVIIKVKPNDTVLVQHPYESIQTANVVVPFLTKRGAKVIALIHDLPSLRKMIGRQHTKYEKLRANIGDQVLLNKCDGIIAHNNSMISYLMSEGFDCRKLTSLEIFDYLSKEPEQTNVKMDRSIVIAGNLEKGKSKYVYELTQLGMNLIVHLFGREYTGTINDHIIFHGQCSPEELPRRIVGSYGLVWDGESLDTCSGNTGEYLRYNNPHKCSLYLASGVPVIIWKDAAMANFINEQGCGFTINSIYEIEEVINSVTEEAYLNMKKNAERIGKKLRNGEYTQKAILSAIEKCKV